MSLVASTLAAQDKSIQPGINRGYEKADLKAQIRRFEGPDRDVVKRKDEILAACHLKPGMDVADVGAGTGLFTRLMAPKVAPGKVYAVDISKRFIEHIQETCREQKITNVVGIVCPPDSTRLPPQSIDLAFICDTYHHLEFPQKTLASIRQALRPGGRLVVVEFHKAGKMKDHIRAGKGTFVQEIVAAGFNLVSDSPLGEPQYILEFVKAGLRPPAVPLVVHDPYFSIWSFSDRLADDWPRHWTGAVHAMSSMVRIDGRTYRLMGLEPRGCPAMPQVGVKVWATTTAYAFEAGGVEVQLSFQSPNLPNNLELMGLPVTYLTWLVRSVDGRDHSVEIYYDNSAEPVVNEAKQPVVWSRPAVPGLEVMRIGSAEQPVLKKKGDNLRIDWGYLHVAFVKEGDHTSAITRHDVARNTFVKEGRLPVAHGPQGLLPPLDDTRMPRPANQEWPVIACSFRVDKVGKKQNCRWLMLAYDDEYSIEYLGQKLRPWWRRNGADAAELLQAAAKVRQGKMIFAPSSDFDRELTQDCRRIGGDGYADLCAMAYREAIGAHKLVAGPHGEPMLFPKENFSNGCIATVDVLYPAAPIFALLSNELLKATATPVFEYAMTDRWKFPFAPHDLGTYPLANGQVYGGGEKTEENQMPVEESGNMLIVSAIISRLDGNTKYVDRYWRLLERWAKYLKEKGLDPENQLCTDDFAGHLAHNANLSLKAIIALGAYARMCEMSGKGEEATQYRATAEQFAKEWMKLADDGDHYRLAFDRPGTWSQKYNLVWDKLLGLRLFLPEVARKEIAFYKTKLKPYGLPLDSRALYTKTDWEVWTATLAESRADFDALMKPVYRFIDETPDRVPLTDWYMTDTGRLKGFRARPVIGGVFIKMLEDPAVWKKWSTWKPPRHREVQMMKSE
jgi:ubiquinone/menaquinone biosynthesis C-methylase UbiE